MTTPMTRDEILLRYRADHPILDAYLTAVHEHSSFNGINETSGGIDVREAARIALQKIGRPARDEFDVDAAEKYIRSLLDEAETLFPPVDKTLAYHVISGLYPLVGGVPTAEAWEAQSDDHKIVDVADVLATVGDHSDDLKALLREALKHAMPAILREITANAQENERRLRSVH